MINKLAKNFLDFTAALVGLLILSPFFALIALLIKRDSPGPIFYWGPRMGKRGKPFQILKFRTMYESPSSYQGPRVTCKEDSRITPLGRWLRDSKINELPQLWNVLIGEMSLVGPRPEDPDIVQNWPIDSRREILSVKPGITSPASILYHDEETLLSVSDVMKDYYKRILPDKMRLDRLYVRNKTFGSDLDIIFWTVAVIFPHILKTPVPEGHLFAGMISRFIHRFITWFAVDLSTSLAVVVMIDLLWRSQGPLNWGREHLIYLAVLLAFMFSGINAVTRLNRIEWSKATIEDAVKLTLSAHTVTGTILILNYFQKIYMWVPFPPLPVALIFTIGLVAQIGFITTRYRWRLLTAVANCWLSWRQNIPGVGERILIVGEGEGWEIATWLLRRKNLVYAFNIIGIVDDEIPQKFGMLVNGCPILGGIKDIPGLVEKNDISLILFTSSKNQSEIKDWVNNQSQSSNIRLVFLDRLTRLVDLQLNQLKSSNGDSSKLERNLEYLATHDTHTGFPNQYLFHERLKHSLAVSRRYNTNLAVLSIDLDGTVKIRDKYGQDLSDEALAEIAKRLTRCIRESDTLAYLGEFKFALILELNANKETIGIVTERISDSLADPLNLSGENVQLCANFQYHMNSEIDEESNIFELLNMNLINIKRESVATSN
jgi:diguanylate cyclase (GGDEF)-like protein